MESQAHTQPVLATRDALRSAKLKMIARVLDADRASDVAVELTDRMLAVVRCVSVALPSDYAALAAMVAEGDFVWAAIVSDEQYAFAYEGRVARFGLCDLDRLTSHLRELQKAYREAC